MYGCVIFFSGNGVLWERKTKLMKLDQSYRLSEIIARKQLGTATDEDLKFLEAWLLQSTENRMTYERIMSGKPVARLIKLGIRICPEKGYARLSKRITQRKYKRLVILMAEIAAVAILGILIPMFLLTGKDGAEPVAIVQSSLIEPGGNRALLILDDGQAIDLEKLDSLSITSVGALFDKKGGKLEYRKSHTATQPGEMNTLIVPQKGEYHLVLSDGTKVWLNSDTRLRYPISFEGNMREVWLEGEACFEVVSNPRMPFIVRSANLSTRVLGTVFNISAYADDPSVMVTLVSGKVAVSPEGKNMSELLPGECLTYDASKGSVQVDEVNTDDVLAWKNGIFLFNREGMDVIVRKLARWYGVEIGYDAEAFGELKFFIKIKRYENIETILEVLKMTGKVDYSITNNKISLVRVKS